MKICLFSFLMVGTMLAFSGSPALPGEKEKRWKEMEKLLPSAVEDYNAEGGYERYDRQTVFRYMDGAAELYRSYDFKGLLVRKYVKKDRPVIWVELFDMGSSEEAFGIFSYHSVEEEVDIGQRADYGGGLLRFFKDRYFVHVFADRESLDVRKDIMTIGKAIAGNIKREGPKPKWIRFLPEKGLVQENIRYFHLHQVLNRHYFLSHENILNLGQKTRAVLAPYRFSEAKEKTYLLLVQYPTRKQAEKGFKMFTKAYMPEASFPKMVMTENGNWTLAKLHQRSVWIVFDAPDKKKAEWLLEIVEQNFLRKNL